MGQIIGRHLNGYLVTGQDLNEVHTELAGNMCQNDVSVADVDIEHGIAKFFTLQGCYFAVPGLNKPDLFVIRC